MQSTLRITLDSLDINELRLFIEFADSIGGFKEEKEERRARAFSQLKQTSVP